MPTVVIPVRYRLRVKQRLAGVDSRSTSGKCRSAVSENGTQCARRRLHGGFYWEHFASVCSPLVYHEQ